MMTKLFAPKVATPSPAPTIQPTPDKVPSIATPAVDAAAEAERKRQRATTGRAATMLSGGASQLSASNLGTTKLLGG